MPSSKETPRPVPRTRWSRRACRNAETIDGDYTADELEFLAAMDRYKRSKRRPFPTWIEVLDVLKSLGYRKVS